MHSLAPTVKLNNGVSMPVIGLGTYLSTDDSGEEAIKDAIDIGYRHIDTAYYYGNEKEVGTAVRAKIAEGVVKREEMFIVTKLWCSFHEPENVETACRKSLENLNLEYIDLYLMHMPMAYEFRGFDGDLMPYDKDGKLVFSETDYVDTWKGMEKCVKLGLAKSIGISNFNSEQTARLIENAEIKPVTNQVECSPGLNQLKLIEFSKKLGVTVTAYSPLGRPHSYAKDHNCPKPALADSRVQEIADKYGKTTGQIVLRFLVEIGAFPIPKSGDKARIADNINIFDFKLQPNELEIMKSFNSGDRCVPHKLCANHKYFPFNIEY